MELRGCVCWDHSLLYRVMETEALQEAEHFFLATHHPMLVREADPRSGSASGDFIPQEELLERLLAPERRHVLAAVVGSAGSGKSHLVRWLALNLPDSADRHVVPIPKVGTNLRSVIEMVLEGMEGERFDDYRERLRTAVGGLTPQRAKLQFLASLAIAVGPEGPRAKDKMLPDVELQQYVVEALPALLNDERFRRALADNSDVVDEIAEHIVGDTGRDRRERRREFRDEDLSVGEWGLKRTELNADARQLFDYLTQPEMLEAVVTWVNLNLDWTVGQMLSLSGEDLSQLMLDVREELGRQGRELVLLVEDFAKLQGIDRQLLEALLVRPDQHKRKLCGLRSVIAVTTGYYGQLEETVRDRVDIAVTMDALDVEKAVGAEDIIPQFASRYLNAARVAEGALENWYAHRAAPGAPTEPVPCACEKCPYREDCHALFGAANGIGLYPFNASALRRMYLARHGDRDRECFNARVLINQVLRHVLERCTATNIDVSFPEDALLRYYGGGKMSAHAQNALRGAAPGDQLERLRVLLEFWGSPDTRSFSPHGLPEAFGLDRISDEVQVDDEEPDEEEEEDEVTTGDLPRALATQIRELDSWSNGEPLKQTTAQRLRELLFAATCVHIDWDAEGLARTAFSGGNRAFRQTSINFVGQSTAKRLAPVDLELPLDGDLTSAALACQGALLFEHYGHWGFPEAGSHLIHYARLIGQASSDVVRQLRAPTGVGGEWDPLPWCVQLLALSAVVVGALDPSGTLEEQVSALFAEWQAADGENVTRSRAWQKLESACMTARQELQNTLSSRVSATKGEVSNSQIVRAHEMVEPLSQALDKMAVTAALPSDMPEDCRQLRSLNSAFDQLLDRAIDEEAAHYREVGELMREHVPEGVSQDALAQALQRTLDQASANGVSPVDLTRTLGEALHRFVSVDLDRLRAELVPISSDTVGPDAVAAIADRRLRKQMDEAERTLVTAVTYLDQLEVRIREAKTAARGQLEAGAGLADLRQQLEELVGITNEIAGGERDAS